MSDLKGKGQAGKQAQQNKGKERADKRARTNDTNVEIEKERSGTEETEQEEQIVGDAAETKVCFIFFGSLRLLT